MKPGALAILKPSVELADYTFEFLGRDREEHPRVYGPFSRYSELSGGKAGGKDARAFARGFIVRLCGCRRKDIGAERKAPSADGFTTIPSISVRVTARDDTFTLAVNEQVVDDWTEIRIAIGWRRVLYGEGEQARVLPHAGVSPGGHARQGTRLYREKVAARRERDLAGMNQKNRRPEDMQKGGSPMATNGCANGTTIRRRAR